MDVRRFSHRRVLVVIGALIGPGLFAVGVSFAVARDFALDFVGLVGIVELAFGLYTLYSNNPEQ